MFRCYEIRLTPPDGTSPYGLFGDLTVTADRDVVLITARLDQSGLHGVLERIRVLRWRLLEVRRTRAAPAEVEEGDVSDTYEIRVVGALGAAGRTAFADLAVDVEPVATVLSGALTQGELHLVLDRVRDLGLELIDVKLAPPRPPG